jgi:hypothetical protein
MLQLASLFAVVIVRRLSLCDLGISRDQIVATTNYVIAVVDCTHLGTSSSHSMPRDERIIMSGFGC